MMDVNQPPNLLQSLGSITYVVEPIVKHQRLRQLMYIQKEYSGPSCVWAAGQRHLCRCNLLPSPLPFLGGRHVILLVDSNLQSISPNVVMHITTTDGLDVDGMVRTPS